MKRIIRELKMRPRWKYDYLKRNYPEMLNGEGNLKFDGTVYLDELVGTTPNVWMGGSDGCYYVKFYDAFYGSFRLGKVIRVVKKRSGSIILRVKEPVDFYDLPINDKLITDRRRKWKKRHGRKIFFENVLYALPPYKVDRIKGDGEIRLEIVAERPELKTSQKHGGRTGVNKKVA